jgi:hypothetical protein
MSQEQLEEEFQTYVVLWLSMKRQFIPRDVVQRIMRNVNELRRITQRAPLTEDKLFDLYSDNEQRWQEQQQEQPTGGQP